MPAITHQKLELRQALIQLVTRRFLELSPDEQEAIVSGLVARLTARMTLDELAAWRAKFSEEGESET